MYMFYVPLITGSIQRLKHAVPKGDKKRKKEVTLQIAKMEAELEDKHTQEQDQLRQVNKHSCFSCHRNNFIQFSTEKYLKLVLTFI